MPENKAGLNRKKIEDTAAAEAGTGNKRAWMPGFIIVSVVIAVILIIFGVFYYQQYIGPFRRTVITMDGKSAVTVDYFLKRAKMANSSPMGMLQSLSNELVIKAAAPKYGIQISAADVDRQLRVLAGGGSGNITEAEFQEWYRQQLNGTKLSDAGFREIVVNSLLADRLRVYLAAKVPTVAEQVHLNSIAVRTYEDAQKVKDRLKAGEKFDALARELSIDGESKDKGGDHGWVPQGVSMYDGAVFALGIGEVSDPLPYFSDPDPTSAKTPNPDAYFLFMVSEKDGARQLEEESLQAIRSRALENWLPGELQAHSIKFNFNSELNAWMNWQLAKK